MRRPGLIAGLLVFGASTGLTTPITRSEPDFTRLPPNATIPANLCGPVRAFLPPPDCSFVVNQFAVVREVVMRRRGPYDPRPYPPPAGRVFGIPEPALFWFAGTGLALLGRLHRPKAAPLLPDTAAIAVSPAVHAAPASRRPPWP